MKKFIAWALIDPDHNTKKPDNIYTRRINAEENRCEFEKVVKVRCEIVK